MFAIHEIAHHNIPTHICEIMGQKCLHKSLNALRLYVVPKVRGISCQIHVHQIWFITNELKCISNV